MLISKGESLARARGDSSPADKGGRGSMTRKLVTSSDAIEFRHLRYFIAAAEHGSFRKAGNSLGLSQSAISRCIADLEVSVRPERYPGHFQGSRSSTFVIL
ncbi:LysR family transcriptional regulator [Paracoccus sp. TD-10]